MNSNIEKTIQKPPRATAARIFSIVSIAVAIVFFIFNLIWIALWNTTLSDHAAKALEVTIIVQFFLYLVSLPIGIIAITNTIKAKRFAAKSPENHVYPSIRKTLTIAITGLILQCVTLIMLFVLLVCAAGNDGNSKGNQHGKKAHKGWVDLGLPSGLLWAECNLGALSPEEFGEYFAWGETVPKINYSWQNYAYCDGSEYMRHTNLTKYCHKSYYGLNGFTDNINTLQPSDDAATVLLGDGARTPTPVNWAELVRFTDGGIWTNQNGINGLKFTAKNGNSIFLPCAGKRVGSVAQDRQAAGYYWSSLKIDEVSPEEAVFFGFGDVGIGVYNNARYTGQSIRAVRIK